jgi:hypothetical protein
VAALIGLDIATNKIDRPGALVKSPFDGANYVRDTLP